MTKIYGKEGPLTKSLLEFMFSLIEPTGPQVWVFSSSNFPVELAGTTKMEKGGLAAYKVYRALSYGVSPLIRLHLRWRRFRGLEHPQRWPERLGHPSHPRRPGPLVWFHAVSLGEGMIAIPVIKHCIQRMPHLNVLMTTTTLSAL